MGIVISNCNVTFQPTPSGVGGIEVGQQVVNAPIITLVGTDDSVIIGTSNVTVTGVGFGIATGTLEIQQDGGDYVAVQTVDVGTWKNYALQFDPTQNGLRYGVTTTMKLTIA
jgi:hypothetical protein